MDLIDNIGVCRVAPGKASESAEYHPLWPWPLVILWPCLSKDPMVYGYVAEFGH